jgi:dihydroflavonol-4-reductase
MKAMVTGANGLIGANLVRELLQEGHEVRAFVRATGDLRALDGLDVEILTGDVLRGEKMVEAARGCDVLFHAAAVFAYWGYSSAQLENIAVTGTRNALEAARRAGVGRVVLTSSSVVLGSSTKREVRDEKCPLDENNPPPYLTAKAIQESIAFTLAAELDLELVAVCPTMSVGPHDYRLGPSNAIICSYLADPFKITFPGGCNIVSVHDVAKGHVLAATRGRPGARYVIGSENLEWPAIHEIISDLCGVPGPHFQANHTSSFLAATAQELVSWLTQTRPLTSREQAKMVGRFYWYSHALATSELGFKPRPARQALAEAIGWLLRSSQISPALRATLKLDLNAIA